MRAKDLPNLSKPLTPEQKSIRERHRINIAFEKAKKIDDRINLLSSEQHKEKVRLAEIKSKQLHKSCLLKNAYATAEAASQAAAIRLHVMESPSGLRVYHCKRCGHWHLTKKPLRISS